MLENIAWQLFLWSFITLLSRPIDSSGGKSNWVYLCRIDMFYTAVSESCSAMSRKMNLPEENA